MVAKNFLARGGESARGTSQRLQAAVIPVPDEIWGEVPKGFVVVKPGCQLSESELIEFCRSRLAHFKCPRSIELVEALPKTATGKT